MNEFLQFAVLGLGFGALYALAAQGVVLIYRGSGVINFAQGAMGMMGAFVYYTLHYHPVEPGGIIPTQRWGFWPSLVGGVLVSALLGLLTYVLVMRPLRRASPLARLVATLGVLTILSALAATGPKIGDLFDWGSTPILLTSFYPRDVIDLGGGVTMSSGAAIVLAVTVGLTAVLWLVYRFTRFGLATTAVAENERASSAIGWSPDLIAGANWALGAGLAGLAGVLIIPFFGGLNVYQLTSLVLAALAAALVGRFTSFPITLAAGLFIGVFQSTLNHYLTDVSWLSGAALGISVSAPFFVIVVYLMVSGTALPIRGYVFDRLPALGTGRLRPGVIVGLTAATTALALRAVTEVGRCDHDVVDLRHRPALDRDGHRLLWPDLARAVGAGRHGRVHRRPPRRRVRSSLRARGVDRDRRHRAVGVGVRAPRGSYARGQPRHRHPGSRARGAGHRVRQFGVERGDRRHGHGSPDRVRDLDRPDRSPRGVRHPRPRLLPRRRDHGRQRAAREGGPAADRGAHQRARRGGAGHQHRGRQALRVRARVRRSPRSVASSTRSAADRSTSPRGASASTRSCSWGWP